MKLQGICQSATFTGCSTERRGAILILTTCALLLGAEAFIDIRAPEIESDEAIFESQPEQQVHLVFSSHLVSLLQERHVPRHVAHMLSAYPPQNLLMCHLGEILVCHVASHCATHASSCRTE